MIITKQKDLDSIICLIQKDSVFIIGCSQCATLCKTGGEDEVKKMIIQKIEEVRSENYIIREEQILHISEYLRRFSNQYNFPLIIGTQYPQETEFKSNKDLC